MNLTASDATTVREFKLEKGHGYVDYLLFVDGDAVGVVETKPAGYSLTSVEFQGRTAVRTVIVKRHGLVRGKKPTLLAHCAAYCAG